MSDWNTLVATLALAVEMRAEQKRYNVASRNSAEKLDAMRRSIALESRFDKEASKALALLMEKGEPT